MNEEIPRKEKQKIFYPRRQKDILRKEIEDELYTSEVLKDEEEHDQFVIYQCAMGIENCPSCTQKGINGAETNQHGFHR